MGPAAFLALKKDAPSGVPVMRPSERCQFHLRKLELPGAEQDAATSTIATEATRSPVGKHRPLKGRDTTITRANPRRALSEFQRIGVSVRLTPGVGPPVGQ
jgi:hypothetical protein